MISNCFVIKKGETVKILPPRGIGIVFKQITRSLKIVYVYLTKTLFPIFVILIEFERFSGV